MIEVPDPSALAVALLVLGGVVLALGGPGPLVPSGGQDGEAPPTVTPPPVASMDRAERIERKERNFSRANALVEPDGYINAENISTENVSLRELVGEKVILVEFWTYSCSNCRATHPYVTEWYRKYEDDGLVVIGVHTPEFDFERRPANVREAVREANITYPVVLDNDWQTWNAWDQKWWPARYLIGIDGFVRYYHAGEGAYDETERMIRTLLAERRAVLNRTDGTLDRTNATAGKIDGR